MAAPGRRRVFTLLPLLLLAQLPSVSLSLSVRIQPALQRTEAASNAGDTEEASGKMEEEEGACEGEMVMIRSYNPDQGLMDNVRRMITELSDNRDTIIALDHKLPFTPIANIDAELKRLGLSDNKEFHRNYYRAIISRLQSVPPSVNRDLKEKFPGRVVPYTYEMLLRNFPELNPEQAEQETEATISIDSTDYARYPNGTFRADRHGVVFPWNAVLLSGRYVFPWIFHNECIHVALRQWEHQRQKRWNYCGLWVIEDDVAYSGNWAALLDKYGGGKADVVTAFALPAWTPGFLASPNFRSHFNLSENALAIAEHVVYYSKPYLDTVAGLMREGYHCASEISSLEIARRFNYSHVEMDTSDWYHGIHQQPDKGSECAKVMQELRGKGIEKLFHPCGKDRIG